MINFAVIFDKDGVLVDTEGIVSGAVESVIKKYSSVPLDENDTKKQRGTSAKATFEFIREKYKLPFSLDESLEKYNEEYKAILSTKNDILMDGAVELLEELKSKNIPFGIATNSNRERTGLTMGGLRNYFEIVVTADDVSEPKPSPEPFLKVSEMLGVNPKNCVVVGDTNNDCLGAKEANMKFIFRDHNLGLELAKNPDLIISSMRELSVEKLENLFK